MQKCFKGKLWEVSTENRKMKAVKMLEMEKCPYYFVGFYKFRAKCFRVHLTEDCKNTSCKRKGCPKKHRKQCQFGGNCQRNNKDKSCELSHNGLESNIERITNQLWESEDLVLKLKQEIIQLQKTNKEKSILINDLECLKPQKLLDKETFYECRHCSKDSENLIVKLKQEIIELQKNNKEKIFSLTTCLLKFLTCRIPKTQKSRLMKKLCDAITIANLFK